MPSKLSRALSIEDTLARDRSRQLSIFCETSWVLLPSVLSNWSIYPVESDEDKQG